MMGLMKLALQDYFIIFKDKGYHDPDITEVVSDHRSCLRSNAGKKFVTTIPLAGHREKKSGYWQFTRQRKAIHSAFAGPAETGSSKGKKKHSNFL